MGLVSVEFPEVNYHRFSSFLREREIILGLYCIEK